MENRSKQPRGRTRSRLSPTDKEVTSKEQIEHLDPFSETHVRDVEASKKWQETGQKKKKSGVAAVADTQRANALAVAGMPDASVDDDIDIEGLSRGDDVRANLVRKGDKWKMIHGSDWKNYIVNLRHKLSSYYTSNRQKVSRGEKGFSEPVRNTFLRLPPWLALELKEADAETIQKTICKFGELYEKETGYPVHAINVHKERANDLHIHITYSDIKQRPVKISAKDKRAYLAKIRERVKEDLKRSGEKSDPKSVKKVMDEMTIEIPVPESKISYQKIIRASRKSETKNKETKDKRGIYAARSMSILGSTYRYKAQLWDAADSDEDKEEVRLYKEDYPHAQGSFTHKVAKCKDLAGTYVDYWAERQFESMILNTLTDERIKRVDESRKTHVKLYIETGRSDLDPLEVALAEDKAAVEKEAESLADEKAEVEQRAQSVDALIETKETELDEDFALLSLVQTTALEVEQSELDKKEQSVVQRESKVNDLLAKKDAELESTKEQIQKDAQNEVWEKVRDVLPRSSKEKTENDILAKIAEDSKKAVAFDKVRPKFVKLLEKVTSKVLPKWLTRAISNIGKDMGISSDDKSISSSGGK